MKGKPAGATLGHFISPLLFGWILHYGRPPITAARVLEPSRAVDLAPTILALNGVAPHVSALFGHDLSASCAGLRGRQRRVLKQRL